MTVMSLHTPAVSASDAMRLQPSHQAPPALTPQTWKPGDPGHERVGASATRGIGGGSKTVKR